MTAENLFALSFIELILAANSTMIQQVQLTKLLLFYFFFIIIIIILKASASKVFFTFHAHIK